MADALLFRWQRAIRKADLPTTRKLIAYTLATYANADGTRVWPGTAALMAATGLSDGCVRGHVRALRAAGWIVQTFRGSSAGRGGRADEYRLAMPEVDQEHRQPGAGVPGRNTGTQLPEHRHPAAKNTGTQLPPTRSGDQTKTRSSRARGSADVAAVRDALQPQTRREITDGHARDAIRDVLDRAGTVKDPTAYVLAAIKSEPGRYLPTPGQPPRACVVCGRTAVARNRCQDCLDTTAGRPA